MNVLFVTPDEEKFPYEKFIKEIMDECGLSESECFYKADYLEEIEELRNKLKKEKKQEDEDKETSGFDLCVIHLETPLQHGSGNTFLYNPDCVLKNLGNECGVYLIDSCFNMRRANDGWKIGPVIGYSVYSTEDKLKKIIDDNKATVTELSHLIRKQLKYEKEREELKKGDEDHYSVGEFVEEEIGENDEKKNETPRRLMIVSLFVGKMRKLIANRIKIVQRNHVQALQETRGKILDVTNHICSSQEFSWKNSKLGRLADEFGKFRIPHILIEGDTGVGKTLVASFIYQMLFDEGKTPVTVNCAGFQKETMGPHLFGYVKGAYTDAKNDNPGLILRNAGNALFLDEITEMPIEIQSKLLVFMQEGIITPLGYVGTENIKVPCMIIAASNRDLKDEKGNVITDYIREDLYHRFAYHIRVPNLKERIDDLPRLIDHILQRKDINVDRYIKRFTEDFVKTVRKFIEQETLQGNFRGLENLVAAAVDKARRHRVRVLDSRHIKVKTVIG